MSTIAIGDIHGNLRALNHLLFLLSKELGPDDTIVFLSDIIDGYPESKGCIERILQFQEESSSKVISIAGNHEEWFIQTMKDPTKHSWILSMKGLSTIGSYSKSAELSLREEMQRIGPPLIIDSLPLDYSLFFREVPQSHKEYFKRMVDFHRTESVVFVHGGVSVAYSAVENEEGHSLRWGHNEFPDDYRGPDTIIYGHWSGKAVLSDGVPNPYEKNNTICLGTIKYGVLTAVRMPDRKLFQSNRYLY